MKNLLVCQIERQGNLAEKREVAILRIESIPGNKKKKNNEQEIKHEGGDPFSLILHISYSLSRLATAYTPNTNSHSPKALFRYRSTQKFSNQDCIYNLPHCALYDMDVCPVVRAIH